MNSIKTTFQDGCDTIVAGCTTYGSTPTSNSPSAIVTSIRNIYTNRYNAGVAATKRALIQYGTFTTTMYGGGTSFNTTTNIVFPESFPTTPTVVCHCTNAKTIDSYITVSNVTSTGFTVKVQTMQSAGGNQTHNMLWIAEETS